MSVFAPEQQRLGPMVRMGRLCIPKEASNGLHYDLWLRRKNMASILGHFPPDQPPITLESFSLEDIQEGGGALTNQELANMTNIYLSPEAQVDESYFDLDTRKAIAIGHQEWKREKNLPDDPEDCESQEHLDPELRPLQQLHWAFPDGSHITVSERSSISRRGIFLILNDFDTGPPAPYLNPHLFSNPEIQSSQEQSLFEALIPEFDFLTVEKDQTLIMISGLFQVLHDKTFDTRAMVLPPWPESNSKNEKWKPGEGSEDFQAFLASFPEGFRSKFKGQDTSFLFSKPPLERARHIIRLLERGEGKGVAKNVMGLELLAVKGKNEGERQQNFCRGLRAQLLTLSSDLRKRPHPCTIMQLNEPFLGFLEVADQQAGRRTFFKIAALGQKNLILINNQAWAENFQGVILQNEKTEEIRNANSFLRVLPSVDWEILTAQEWIHLIEANGGEKLLEEIHQLREQGGELFGLAPSKQQERAKAILAQLRSSLEPLSHLATAMSFEINFKDPLDYFNAIYYWFKNRQQARARGIKPPYFPSEVKVIEIEDGNLALAMADLKHTSFPVFVENFGPMPLDSALNQAWIENCSEEFWPEGIYPQNVFVPEGGAHLVVTQKTPQGRKILGAIQAHDILPPGQATTYCPLFRQRVFRDGFSYAQPIEIEAKLKGMQRSLALLHPSVEKSLQINWEVFSSSITTLAELEELTLEAVGLENATDLVRFVVEGGDEFERLENLYYCLIYQFPLLGKIGKPFSVAITNDWPLADFARIVECLTGMEAHVVLGSKIVPDKKTGQPVQLNVQKISNWVMGDIFKAVPFEVIIRSMRLMRRRGGIQNVQQEYGNQFRLMDNKKTRATSATLSLF